MQQLLNHNVLKDISNNLSCIITSDNCVNILRMHVIHVQIEHGGQIEVISQS